MLDYKVIQSLPVPIIFLQGRFDSSGALVFEEEFKKNESQFPVLDFSNINYLSSAGIRVLLQSEKFLRHQNGKLIFSSVGNNIKQVLEITGLLKQFTFVDTSEEGVQLAIKLIESAKESFNQIIGNHTYLIKCLSVDKCKTDIWRPSYNDTQNLISVNLDQFDFAIGTGGLGCTREEIKNTADKLIITKKFIGVVPQNEEPDYLISQNYSDTFFYLNSAINFSDSPNFVIELTDESLIPVGEFIKNSFSMVTESVDYAVPAIGFVLIANSYVDTPVGLLSIGVITDKLNGKVPDELISFKDSINVDDNISFSSVAIKLKSNNGAAIENLKESIDSILDEGNISGLNIPSADLEISQAKVWLFIPEFYNAQETRLKIEFENDVELRDEFEVIIRKIYSDCSKIRLQQLHGGFSAKTFQIFGYDKNGIRILPTVLKLAKIDTVKREVGNFEANVKRYILNNSTAVMGSCYFGEYGGVRYNFVGITGPDSKVGWLTHYYREKAAEELIPIFDRIFTDILRPWYGQPRLETFNPYKEHNPTTVFFAELFDECEKQLGISPDVERIYFDELKREIINPYWFLKHGYKQREKYSKLWYKCICHGDLNMQNILLDELENVYIIDYSETSPRNAVSDFARLEPIFKFEFPEVTAEEMKNLIKFEQGLLMVNTLNDIPQFTYSGKDPFVEKSYKMICRLRKYADTVTLFENDLIPYLLAVLEWTYAVVCFQSVDKMVKRLSAISAALTCEKILELEGRKH